MKCTQVDGLWGLFDGGLGKCQKKNLLQNIFAIQIKDL